MVGRREPLEASLVSPVAHSLALLVVSCSALQQVGTG
jgi:hypothetical protein